jgi:histidine ammonia-lyase
MKNADPSFHILTTLISSCRGDNPPKLSKQEEEKLQREHRHLHSLLSKGTAIYGFNRRPGHREPETELSAELLSEQILKSHAIGEAPWYSPSQVRSIGVAKLAMWRAGGSGVSLELYNRVAKLLSDKDFQPLVPKNNTYSAGDVIPAAHWAESILRGSPTIGRHVGEPEIMTLLNGAFIHAGLSLASIPMLRDAWVLFFETTVSLMQCIRNNSFLREPRIGLARAAIEATEELRSATNHFPMVAGLQDSISIRGTDEIFETLLDAIERMAQRLTEALQRPSGNPLVSENQSNGISQASFFLPALTISQGAVIESLLLTMWAQVGRTTFLLSGQIPSVPQDGATRDNPLGLIQYPKKMTALLERARSVGGISIYGSGGSTSHGIEDLWSHGVTTTEKLIEVCKCFFEMSAIEACVLQHLRNYGFISPQTALDSAIEKLQRTEKNLKPSSVCSMTTEILQISSSIHGHGFPVKF